MNWYKKSQLIDQTVIKSLQKRLMDEYPGLDLELWISNNAGGYVELAVLEVPKNDRGQGIGHEVVNRVKSFASKLGFPVVVRPSPERGKKGALNRFYKDLGFIDNKGRYKDWQISSPFSATKYWKPIELNFENLHIDHHSGQDDYILAARYKSLPVGAIDYSVFNDEIYINMIRVIPKYRRQGVASRLYKKLEEYNQGVKINWRGMTPEGYELQKSVVREQEKIAESVQRLKSYGVEIEDGKAILYRGTDVPGLTIDDLRYGDYLSSKSSGHDATGNLAADTYGKYVERYEIPIEYIKITNGELQYKGHSKSISVGKKYPIEIYKSYNDVYGSNYTAEEIDTMNEDHVKSIARMGLPGGVEEFNSLINKHNELV